MSVKKAILSVFSAVLAWALVSGCGAGQERDLSTTANLQISNAQEKFFTMEPQEDELFRIFASSENYEIRQYGSEKEITIQPDHSGEEAFTKELSAYDKIEFFSDAIFRVELYEDTGSISRIRPVKPARISELNKLIADDITRLKFEIPAGQVAPLVFHIRYGIYLQKKVSDREIRETLKENLR